VYLSVPFKDTAPKINKLIFLFVENQKCHVKIGIMWRKKRLKRDRVVWPKKGISVKSPNFDQKSKFRSKIQISVKARNFCQKSKFRSKIQISLKTRWLKFRAKFTFLKFRVLTESWIFDRNWDHWPKFRSLTEIGTFDRNPLFSYKFWSKIQLSVKKTAPQKISHISFVEPKNATWKLESRDGKWSKRGQICVSKKGDSIW